MARGLSVSILLLALIVLNKHLSNGKKIKVITTPGGRPGKNLKNPPSLEVGPMDSGRRATIA